MKQNPVSDPAANDTDRAIQGFFLCIAAVFFLFAFIFAIWNFYLLLTFAKTEGVIASIGVRQTSGKTPATFYDLWVGFQASKYQIYTRAGTSVFYTPYNKGDKAMIYYDPQNPNDAFVNTFGTIWFVPTIIFLLGLIPFIISKPNIKDFKIIYQKLLG